MEIYRAKDRWKEIPMESNKSSGARAYELTLKARKSRELKIRRATWVSGKEEKR